MWLAAGGTLLVLLMALGLLAAGRLGGGALVVVTVTPAPSPSATPKPTSASGPAHTPLVGSPTIVTPILPTPASTLPPDLVPALVKVPTGPFLMGSSADDPQAQDNEKPQKSLSLPDYWIGKTEVTNAQFRPFVEGDGYTNQAYWTAAGWAWRQDQKRTQPSYWNDKTLNASDQPVVGVTWYEAVAYCRWLSAQTGREFRLPTEAEWEKAARGTDGQIYPWGNTWAAGRANTKEAGVNTTQPVGKYPAGASPSGALDMAGNVWEWCATVYKPYPYTIEDEWTTAYLEGDGVRVLRGGSWYDDQMIAREAYRYDYFAHFDLFNNVGLRVASASPSS
jgi:formylglycine-generating enzyme required for sulfatase activity